jgi:ATP-dependent Clp protease ATP-binding subunit ClpB
MSFKPDTFTVKALEAIQESEVVARQYGHAELHPVHLLAVLRQDNNGLLKQLFNQCGIETDALDKGVEAVLCRLPKQTPMPETIQPSRSFIEMLHAAQTVKVKQGDSHIAVDTLLRALAQTKETKEVLSGSGMTGAALESAVKELRKGRKVESETADGP